jgi:DivIVA domain-containing protein
VTELSLLLYPQTAPLYPEGDGVAFAGVCAEVREMGSSCPSRTEDAMSVYQRDAEAGRPETEDRPAFRVVRRGYDREEVDGYLAQLVARLGEAVDQYAKAEQARAELQREVLSLREGSPSFEQLGGEAAALLQEAGRSAEQLVENARRRADTITEKAQQQAEQMRRSVEDEAQKVLEQAREVAEQIRRDVEQERAALFSETEQVREFRDGLLDDLGRVHGEISGLLERTRKQRDQALLSPGGADAKAEPAADAKPGRQAEPAQPAKVGEPE